MTKQEIIGGINAVTMKAKAAAIRKDVFALRSCTEEAYELLNAARAAKSPKLVKQAREAFYGVTGLEDYVATSI